MRILAWPDRAGDANPYTRLLYDAVRQARPNVVVTEFSPSAVLYGSFDVWHVHWPEYATSRREGLRALVDVAAFVALVCIAKLRRIRIVWTVHNLGARAGERASLQGALRWFFARATDGIIVLTSEGLSRTYDRYPVLRQRPAAIIRHGHYLDAYPNSLDKHTARRRLGLPPDATVLACIGRIAPYKNVIGLVREFARYGAPDAVLLIAGEPSDQHTATELRNAAGQDPRIYLALNHVPDGEIQCVVNAADVIVLPYKDVFNSGVLFLASSFSRPALLPHCGPAAELEQALGSSWVQTYSGDIAASDLASALSASREARGPASTACALRAGFGWDRIADETLTFFESMIAERRQQ